MVNVGGKPVTRRTAHAVAVLVLPPEVARLAREGALPDRKGPVMQTSALAGIMGAKKTSELIPLCHPLRLDDCKVELEMLSEREIAVHCRVEAHEKTGVEMEALTGAAVAALTFYDMTKALSHEIVIREIRLIEKTGGKSDFRQEPREGAASP